MNMKTAESPLTSLVRRTSSKRVRQAAKDERREDGQGREMQSAWRYPQQQEEERQRRSEEENQEAYDYAGAGSSSRPSLEAYRRSPSPNATPAYTTTSYSSHPYATAQPIHDHPEPDLEPEPPQHTPPRKQPSHLRLDPSNIKPSLHTLTSEHLHSPLLHSHFSRSRDSVATASDVGNDSHRFTISEYYDDYADSSFPDARGYPATRSSAGTALSMRQTQSSELEEYRYFSGVGDDGDGDDASSVYSSATMGVLGGPALRDSWRSTDTGSTVRRDHLSGYGGQPVHVPTLVVSSPDQHELVPKHDSEFIPTRGGRTPIVKPVTANFSRPVREAALPEHATMGERVEVQLPVEMREQKKVVLERNAGRTPGGTPAGTPGGYARSPLGREVNAGGGGEASSYFGDRRPSTESVQSRAPLSQTRSEQGPTRPPMVQTRSLQPTDAHQQPQPHSPVSLYSTYSYYQYDGAVPSPTGSGDFPKPKSKAPSIDQRSTRSKTPEPSAPSGTRTPQDYLQLGIQHHEANRLQESARCFERSAKEGGGCGVGMLMYGLALRHGWGCAKNEALGFKWVQKAAESAVGDLERMRKGLEVDMGAVQTELVLAIYEVGQCFFHGWGVAKDQKMGVSYYQVAARLGDGDAQGDLAFCLANGKGCKKDKKEAAKWYRAAVKQGQSDVGLAWIYKEKYQ